MSSPDPYVSGTRATGAQLNKVPRPTLGPDPVLFVRVGPVDLRPHLMRPDRCGGLLSLWRRSQSLPSKSLNGWATGQAQYPEKRQEPWKGVL